MTAFKAFLITALCVGGVASMAPASHAQWFVRDELTAPAASLQRLANAIVVKFDDYADPTFIVGDACSFDVDVYTDRTGRTNRHSTLTGHMELMSVTQSGRQLGFRSSKPFEERHYAPGYVLEDTDNNRYGFSLTTNSNANAAAFVTAFNQITEVCRATD